MCGDGTDESVTEELCSNDGQRTEPRSPYRDREEEEGLFVIALLRRQQIARPRLVLLCSQPSSELQTSWLTRNRRKRKIWQEAARVYSTRFSTFGSNIRAD